MKTENHPPFSFPNEMVFDCDWVFQLSLNQKILFIGSRFGICVFMDKLDFYLVNQSSTRLFNNRICLIVRKPKSKLCEVGGDAKSDRLTKIWKWGSILNRELCDLFLK